MTAAKRHTRQKTAIQETFTVADRPLAPEEVLALAKERVQGISLATVYRNISSLVDEGRLAVVELPGRTPRYEVAGKVHHHHFQCSSCERVYELGACEILPKPSVPKGFHVTGHEFVVYGTCADCQP